MIQVPVSVKTHSSREENPWKNHFGKALREEDPRETNTENKTLGTKLREEDLREEDPWGKNTPPEEEDPSERQISGGRAVSASGLQGKNSHEGIAFSTDTGITTKCVFIISL